MTVKVSTKNLKPRPPVVVVMGHVDHGKTTLLDYIRKANVAGKEKGGITQSIGAYEIIHNTRKITFIDTPGHEAFSKMRFRGTEIADLAVLVVAADESVKPQTKEALEILKRANRQFVVAITKMDKPGADINKVKNDLTTAGVLLEGYGGQVIFHGVSSKTGEGISDLLDLIILSSDMENPTFNPSAPASGYVLETKNDPRRGSEASVIIRDGALVRGGAIYTQTTKGKIKVLEDFLGNSADKLEPSSPALVIGFEKLPRAGEFFSAEPVTEAADPVKPVALRTLAEAKARKSALKLILKAADTGSLDALSTVIDALGTKKKRPVIVEKSIGNVTDGDVKSAIATESVIVGFKSEIIKAAQNLAQVHDVKIITSGIIYDLAKAIEEFLVAVGKPASAGELDVIAVFSQDKLRKQLVGGKILSGMVRNKAPFEILRGSPETGEKKTEGAGRVMSLREKKTEITQAEIGKEIGLVVNATVLINIGDRLVFRK